jgi:hypothetical protein
LTWKQTVAVRFVFNPNEPVNPIDLANLKSRIANRKTTLERSIRTNLTALQQESAQSADQRKKLIAAANRGFEAAKQAAINEQAADGRLQKASKFVAFCCAGLAAIGLLKSVDSQSEHPPSTASQIAKVDARPTNSPAPLPNQSSNSGPRIPLENQKIPPSPPSSVEPVKPMHESTVVETQHPPGAARVPDRVPEPNLNISTRSDSSVSRPSLDSQPSSGLPLNTTAAPNLSNDNTGTKIATASAPSVPALPPAQEIRNLSGAGSVIADATPHLDLSIGGDAARVQQRLIEAGFLSGAVDGRWGPKSKSALQQFKISKKLGDDSTWDARTEEALFGSDNANLVSSEPITLSFSGGWTNAPGACGGPSDPAPLTINGRGATTYAGYCQFNSVRQEGNGLWRVTAICSSEGKSWAANIRFVVTRSTLKWSSEKGEQIFYRCAG